MISSLQVNVLFETTYLDKCNRGIFVMECMILPEPRTPVAKFEAGTEAKLTSISLHEMPSDDQKKRAMIRVAKLNTIPVEMESPIVVVTSKFCLVKKNGFRGKEDKTDTQRKWYLWDLHEHPIPNIGDNCFEKACCTSYAHVQCFGYRSKGMYWRRWLNQRAERDSNAQRWTIKGSRKSTDADPVSYKFEHAEAEQTAHDWKEEDRIILNVDKHRNRIMTEIMTSIQPMANGRVDGMSIAKAALNQHQTKFEP